MPLDLQAALKFLLSEAVAGESPPRPVPEPSPGAVAGRVVTGHRVPTQAGGAEGLKVGRIHGFHDFGAENPGFQGI